MDAHLQFYLINLCDTYHFLTQGIIDPVDDILGKICFWGSYQPFKEFFDCSCLRRLSI